MIRNESIDVIKGFLIIAVIIGHILLGGLDDNILRFFIYSFHMPAFFFISGYLLNLGKIQKSTPQNLVKTYWKRMLLRWGIALLVYSMFLTMGNFSIKGFVGKVVNPYYHLWYVPTLFIFIIIIKSFRYIKDDVVFWVLLLIIGILFYNLDLLIPMGQIKLDFFIYFLIGLFARYFEIRFDNVQIGKGIFVLFSVLIIVLYFCNIPYDYYATHLRTPFLISLCILIILPIINKEEIKSALLSAIGRNSLEIYLWHVFPLLVMKKFFIENQRIYYISAFAVLSIFLIIMWRIESMKIKSV